MRYNQRREMPEDFAAHAGETYRKLQARYHASSAQIRRWLGELGLQKRRPRGVIRHEADGSVTRFPTIGAAAASIFGADSSGICAAIKRNGTAYGYRWSYEEARR